MKCSEFFAFVSRYDLEYVFEADEDYWGVIIPLDLLYEVPSEGDYFSFGPLNGYCTFVDWEMREVGMQVDLDDY